jgi:hypothetical protein
VFDFQGEGIQGFTPGGCDRTLWVLIAVHRGCTSELCGVRQRHAVAHELESKTQEKKAFEVTEHLRR